MSKGLKLLSSMSERKQKFVALYAESGDQRQAYLDAGYNPGPRTLAANSRALMKELKPYIEEAIHERIGGHAPMALKHLSHLMTTAKSEQVQLKAAMNILDRAGYQETQKIEIQEVGAAELNNKELDEHIAKLAATASLKVINGGKS